MFIHTTLLSYETAIDLKILNEVNSIEEINDIIDNNLRNISHGIGTYKGGVVKLHIDESVKPTAQPHRRIPFHMRKKVETELQRLEDCDVIEKVTNKPTPWVSPIVVAPKPKSPEEIRICVDMRLPNKAIKRERHVTPTIDDVIADLSGAEYFSKLDLRTGYHQLLLHPDSRYITTFSTHAGLYRYKSLSFGINSAAEIFQQPLQESLRGSPGVVNISDDILVKGNTVAEHDENLLAVILKLKNSGYTINYPKCVIRKQQVDFHGPVISHNGISADPLKLHAIREASPPQNPEEVRSLLGMGNYVSRFVRNFSTIVQPLRELTKSDVKWQWGPQQELALQQLKYAMTRTTVMNYYDPNMRTEVSVDASPVGLGAILAQRQDGSADPRIAAYASRALTPVERRYSQIEREALAIVWGCERFHLYLYGSEFDLRSDHKPLELIFNNPKSRPPARIEWWALRPQPYCFTVKHIPGVTNLADYMSRHPTDMQLQSHEEIDAEEYVNFLAYESIPKTVTLHEIVDATSTDTALQLAITAVQTGRWHDARANAISSQVRQDIESFDRVQNELTVTSDGSLLLRGTRLVIPRSIQLRVLKVAHAGHLDLVKTKQLIREKVWFPGVCKLASDLITNCIACQATVPAKQSREPYNMSPLPDGPWMEVSVDFKVLPNSEYLLVITDDYSRYPIVEIITSTAAKVIIPVLDKVFAVVWRAACPEE